MSDRYAIRESISRKLRPFQIPHEAGHDHLVAWRKARAGGSKGLEAKRRGPTPKVTDERDVKLAEQARELESWKGRAELAEALVEVQKKVAAILGISLPENGGKR